MWQYLYAVWDFRYAAVPCIFAYLVFDLPILYRRFTRRMYVPVYFAFSPFGFSDELYARYFDEDDFGIAGGAISESEVNNVRVKIIWISVLSLALTMSVSPFLAALFSHYALTPNQQTQFFYTLAAVKGIALCRSVYDLRWNFRVTDSVPLGYLVFTYMIYLVAILTIYSKSLSWIAAKDLEGGITAIGQGILDFMIFDIGVGVVFVGLIGFLVPWRLTSGTARPFNPEGLNDES